MILALQFTPGVIIGGIAMAIFLISSLLKTKRQILINQSIAHVLLAISEALAKTFSSIVQEAVSIIRNISVLFGKNTKWLNIALVAFATVFGIFANIYFDGNSWFGYLPVIANLEYSIIVISPFNNEKVLKISLSISSALWGIFFIVSNNFLAGYFNIATATFALISGLILIFGKKKTKKEDKQS